MPYYYENACSNVANTSETVRRPCGKSIFKKYRNPFLHGWKITFWQHTIQSQWQLDGDAWNCMTKDFVPFILISTLSRRHNGATSRTDDATKSKLKTDAKNNHTDRFWKEIVTKLSIKVSWIIFLFTLRDDSVITFQVLFKNVVLIIRNIRKYFIWNTSLYIIIICGWRSMLFLSHSTYQLSHTIGSSFLWASWILTPIFIKISNSIYYNRRSSQRSQLTLG